MTAEKIFLENFRNYNSADVSFSEGINVIYGKNGAGKTNLIEALYAFSYARSFRSSVKEFIKHGEEMARMALVFRSEGRVQSADMVFSKDNKKKIRINEIDIKRTSSLLGRFICILFTPDEMSLVKGGPEFRRKFLDSSITSIRPGYFNALSTLMTCIKQKNALLKSGNYSTLDIWNEKIAESGAAVSMMRERYVKKLFDKAKESHFDISGGKEELEVIYSHSYKIDPEREKTKENILSKIEEASMREKEQKMCLIGPHRDDLSFKINNFNARHFASQGQNRSIVLSLKTSQMEMIRDATGEYPLLLLDDVLSELDFERREFLTEKIKGKQVIISCTDIDNIEIARSARLIKVEGGKICT